ncbi:MAG: hypothetical protein KatS3mg087_1576 [Patescibacteria group bacterium]|nr:MAG: hypothetical protein KatS3mg087_1576 [Patescibacteria group bacterium]
MGEGSERAYDCNAFRIEEKRQKTRGNKIAIMEKGLRKYREGSGTACV